MANKLFSIGSHDNDLIQWSNLAAQDKSANPWDYADDLSTISQYMNSTNAFGISKIDNPFSKGNISNGIGAMANTSIGKGILDGLSGFASTGTQKLLSNGLNSAVGSSIGNIGRTAGGMLGTVSPLLGAIVSVGSGLIGGGVNALFGTKTDSKKLAAAQEGTNYLRNFMSNASTFDDIQGLTSVANVQDAHRGGLFRKGWANGKNNAIKQQRADALDWAQRGIENNIYNISQNNLGQALANWHAYGGPFQGFGGGALGIMQSDKYINAINNRTAALSNKMQFPQIGNAFDLGGLKMKFVDEFGEDPIGAAIRYNKGVEQLESQREAAEAERAKADELVSLQQRMAELETQNQGLQSMLNAIPTPETKIVEREVAVPYATDSPWEYIEAKLKSTGKFNDVQIEGIKRNLQRESGINPDAVGDNGTAKGIAQWHSDRMPSDMTLEGQTQHLIDTIAAYDGRKHWVGRDNYEGFMNARTPEEAHYYIARGYERPAGVITDRLRKESDMSLKNMNAFGGELGTNGTDWTNGLLNIDAGSSHEDNPLGGVPMGVDAEGIPNFVEEGETVYKDYVFSDRINVPTFMYNELGLGGSKKNKGISFADASKKLAKESEQRPNDPISQAGLDAALAKLAEVQETERMRKRAEEYNGLMENQLGLMAAYGGQLGNMYDGTGNNSQWLEKSKHNRNLHPSRFKKDSITNNKKNAWSPNLMELGTPPYSFNPTGGWSPNDVPAWDNPRLYGFYTDGDNAVLRAPWTGFEGRPALKISKENSIENPKGKTNTASTNPRSVNNNKNTRRTSSAGNATVDTPVQPAATTTPSSTSPSVTTNSGELTMPFAAYASNTSPKASNNNQYEWDVKKGYDEGLWGFKGYTEPNDVVVPLEFSDVLEKRKADPNDPINTRYQNKEKYPEYDTWMRYAPAWGAGLMTLTDAMGLTNKPDYTYADKIEAAANAAGYAPNINPEYIGDYLTFRPEDIWREQNRMNATSNAAVRSLRNNGNNPAAIAAGTIANSYNSQLASGDLYQKALAYNDAQRQQVADFNRKTNMFNSQMGLEAAMANARYRQAAANASLEGLAKAAAMREAIDQRVGAARSANITNLLNSLGNIGRENFALNQIMSSRNANNGYWTDSKGLIHHNGKVYAEAAYGGKIKKNKK